MVDSSEVLARKTLEQGDEHRVHASRSRRMSIEYMTDYYLVTMVVEGVEKLSDLSGHRLY